MRYVYKESRLKNLKGFDLISFLGSDIVTVLIMTTDLYFGMQNIGIYFKRICFSV